MTERKQKAEAPEGAPKPVSTISKDDRTPTETPCLCGCGELAPRTFKAGHDMRMFKIARAHLTGEAEATGEQLAYLKESGKLERTRTRLEAEEAKREAKAAAKSEAQREKEGEAEAKTATK